MRALIRSDHHVRNSYSDCSTTVTCGTDSRAAEGSHSPKNRWPKLLMESPSGRTSKRKVICRAEGLVASAQILKKTPFVKRNNTYGNATADAKGA
jgi:hypothetical protein